jgi:transposase
MAPSRSAPGPFGVWLRFVRGLSIRDIHRRTGLHREAIRRALASDGAPVYRRPPAGSKLDPFKDEIDRLLAADPRLSGQRVRELIAPLGFEGGQTIVDDYGREVRPCSCRRGRFSAPSIGPGEICRFDLWEPKAEVPVGHGQTRRGWVVVACLGYSRAGAGALIFTKQRPHLLPGIRRDLWSPGRAPEDAGLGPPGRHPRATRDRPTSSPRSAASSESTWRFCERADRQAKGAVERMQDFIERSFEPGRTFANELDFQLQLDLWFEQRGNPRHHKTLRCRPIDRLLSEREQMAPLPKPAPDCDRRSVTRFAPDRPCV